jgi:hypothetical protein
MTTILGLDDYSNGKDNKKRQSLFRVGTVVRETLVCLNLQIILT